MKRLLGHIIFALIVVSWLIPTAILGLYLCKEDQSVWHPLVGKAIIMVFTFVSMTIFAAVARDEINYYFEKNNWFGFFDAEIKGGCDGRILRLMLICLAIYNLLSVLVIMAGLVVYYAYLGVRRITSRRCSA